MNLFRKLGPGLLYAGAAIGVSHLVQSTKAGATYGLTLIGIVLITNLLKYPFFEFGVRYAQVTGNSLLDGYKKLGKWGIPVFVLVTVSTMFTVVAAVTMVTAGLFQYIFGAELTPFWWSFIILFICVIILFIGQYQLLDRLVKWVVILLSITLIISLISAVGSFESRPLFGDFSMTNSLDIIFLVGLVGWMPAPFDIAVWNSVWTTEKQKLVKRSLKESLFDFHIGYWGTALLACLFLALGAFVFFGTNENLSSSGVVFSQQVISIFTENIGSWSYPIIAFCALATMFSTTLTCFDAFPRTLSKLSKEKNTYWLWIFIIATGALVIIGLFISNMGQMIKVATAISFVSAPVLAIMNHLVIYRTDFPKKYYPSTITKIVSWTGSIFLVGFALYYIYYLL